MMVIGLLSTKQEVEELTFVSKICDIEERIHFIVRMQKIKDLLRKERNF